MAESSQVTLNDVKFVEANKTMAAVAWIPLVGLILMFVEKNDQMVRYNGAQSTIIGVAQFVFSIVWGMLTGALVWSLFAIWSLLSLVGTLVGLAVFVLLVVGFVKALQGQRFDVPVVSGLALKLMNAIK